MKHLFIINPAAGSRDRTEEFTQRIQTACEAAGLTYEICVSEGPGDCMHLARRAAKTGEELRIYACGGDGTLNEVAAGAAAMTSSRFSASPGRFSAWIGCWMRRKRCLT